MRQLKEKIAVLGQHVGINTYLMTPGFQNCLPLPLKKHLFTQKLLDCQFLTPTSLKLPFFGGNLGEVEIVEYIS
jgi:hypothetical protein